MSIKFQSLINLFYVIFFVDHKYDLEIVIVCSKKYLRNANSEIWTHKIGDFPHLECA